MLDLLLKFFAIWFIGASALGLLFGRMIKGPGETPALILKSADEYTEAIEEKVG